MSPSSEPPPPSAYRRWVLGTMAGLLGILGLLALQVFVFDPFLHYHKPWFGYGFVAWNDTYLNPGLARHVEYDAIVAGGSYVQNTKVSSVNRHFGVRSLKLTKAGGTPADLHRLLRLGLESGRQVKLAIVALPLTKFESDEVEAIRSELPEYLYDTDWLNDVSYLLNVDVYWDQAKSLYRWLRTKNKTEENWLDEAYSWIGRYRGKTGKANLLKHYRVPARGTESPADRFVAGAEKQFEAHLKPMIEAHPGTTFKLFFPPFSRLLWRDKLDLGLLRAELEIKRVLAQRLLVYPNVELYDFMDIPETADLENYKDRSHFLPPVMERITSDMASGVRRLTAAPSDSDIASFIELVRAYEDPDIPRTSAAPAGDEPDNVDNF